jgi:ATP-binding cassette, subfamily C, bacterial
MKYPVILQHNEEDCGAACLATIAKYYGQIYSLTRVREASGTGQLGTTLLNLKQGSQVLGFQARGVRVPLELVDQHQIPLPGIIHWKGNHWTVLYGKQGRHYLLADPLMGLQRVSCDALLAGWANGIMLLLEPQLDFGRQPDDREKMTAWQKLGLRVWHYRFTLTEALLLNLVVGLLALLSPFLLQILTDDVLIRKDTQLLTGLLLGVLVMNLASSGLQWVQANLVAHFAQRLELDLMLEFSRTLLGLPLAYFEMRRSGEVASRLRDIQTINQLVAQVGIVLPGQLAIALVSVGLMILYSPSLALIALGIAVGMSLPPLLWLIPLRKRIYQVLGITAENQAVLVETFKGALAVKTTNATAELWQEFQSRYGKQAHTMFRTVQIAVLNRTSTGLIANLGATLLLGLGSHWVVRGQLTIGQLLAFSSLSGNLNTLLSSLANFAIEFTRTQAATERLEEVMDATLEFTSVKALPWVTLPEKVEINCQQLYFHHPGRTELLQDFSLTLPAGQTIALIGPSGCGKSTLAKLLVGLYQPQSGNIRIHHYNLADLDPICLRSQVVLVSQEAHFWSRSILDNLRLGNPNVSFEAIVNACQIAQADQFISRLPEKYQTILGEFGANLSGGQRQRLALARGLIQNPSVLILDESTASLDPMSEAAILDQLLQVRQGKTTILISHRSQVINRADWVVFLAEGRLKVQGQRTELLTKPGEHLAFLEA